MSFYEQKTGRWFRAECRPPSKAKGDEQRHLSLATSVTLVTPIESLFSRMAPMMFPPLPYCGLILKAIVGRMCACRAMYSPATTPCRCRFGYLTFFASRARGARRVLRSAGRSVEATAAAVTAVAVNNAVTAPANKVRVNGSRTSSSNSSNSTTYSQRVPLTVAVAATASRPAPRFPAKAAVAPTQATDTRAAVATAWRGDATSAGPPLPPFLRADNDCGYCNWRGW